MRIETLVRKVYEVTTPYAGVASIEDVLVESSFLVVMEQGRFVGILTPADVVRYSHRLVIDCLCDKPRVDYEYEIEFVLELMKEKQDSVLPVFKGDEFIGVVTQGDLTEYLFEYRKDLGQKVAERTAELATTNEQLQRELAERKRAEEALRESEATARALLNAPTDAAALVDTRGIILDVNETMARRFGKPAEELIGVYGWDLIPADLAERRKAYADQVIQSDEPVRFEDERQGTWFDNVIYPVLDAQGKVTKIALLARDITKRKRTEEDIKQRNRELAAPNAIANATNRYLHLEEVLDVSVEKAKDIVGADTGCVLLLEGSSHRLRVWGAQGLSPELVKRFEAMTLDEDYWQKGAPLDVTNLWRISDSVKGIARNAGLVSCILLPLRWENTAIGIMWLAGCRDNALVQWSMEFLMTVSDQLSMAVKNALLYEEAQRELSERKRAEEEIRQRTAQLETLRKVGLELTTELDLDTLLHSIALRAVELLGGTAGGLYLYRPERDVLEWAVPSGYDPAIAGIVLHRGEGLSGKVWEAGEPLIVDDYQHWEGRATVWEGYPIRATMGVPVHWGGQFLGVLSVDRDTTESFSPADSELLTMFAAQAAIAIQNAQLYEQVQRDAAELEQRVTERTRDLETLYEVTTVTSETLDLQVMLERSLDRMLEALHCHAGAIQLLDDADGASGGRRLGLAAQQGIPSNLMAELDSLPVDGGLMGWVLEHGLPLMVPNIAADPRASQGLRVNGFPVYLGAPMRAGGQVLGVISVFGEADQQFSVEDVALFASVADHMGVAVQNARLHQRAEAVAVIEERERLARELHDSITQSLYSLTLFARAAKNSVEGGKLDRVSQHLDEMGTTAQQALKEMRLMLYELRPMTLGGEGLVGALRRRVEAVERRANVEARVLADTLTKLPPPLEEGLYHIAQEALNNALKHAAATAVTVHIHTEGDHVIMEISDNGQGFDPDAASGQGGMGLANMRQRAEKLGGSLTISSAPGEGTRVRVSISTRRSS